MRIEPDRDEATCERCGSVLSGQTGGRSAQITPVHLYSNEGYDESEVWCSSGEPISAPLKDGKPIYPTRHPGEATCERCLSAARSFGEAAAARQGKLRR